MEETSDASASRRRLEIRGPARDGHAAVGVPTFRVGNLVRDVQIREEARREAEHYLTARRRTRETSRSSSGALHPRFGLASVARFNRPDLERV